MRHAYLLDDTIDVDFDDVYALTNCFTGYSLSNWNALNRSEEATIFKFAYKAAIF